MSSPVDNAERLTISVPVSLAADVDAAVATPMDEATLVQARSAYGESTKIWARTGSHQVDAEWWLGLSGTPHVEYNLAMLHGPNAADVAPELMAEIARAKVPGMVILAGQGRAAAAVLEGAGWVYTGSKPLMARRHGSMHDDPNVRLLTAKDLPAARELAGAAFGVPAVVGAIAYADDRTHLEGREAFGLFDDEELKSCVITMAMKTSGFSVGWALATAPHNQRAGFGRRLVRACTYRRVTGNGPPVALLMASDAGYRLYEQEGYRTQEQWDFWSRPRWVLR